MSLLGHSRPGRTAGDVPGSGRMDGEVEIEMELESRRWRPEGGGCLYWPPNTPQGQSDSLLGGPLSDAPVVTSSGVSAGPQRPPGQGDPSPILSY